MSLQSQFLEHLQTLAPKAKKFLLAVSGGSDSVALLRLMKESSFEIEVAHFDHALRETSSQDALFVRELCQKLNVPLYTRRVDVASIAKERKWNIEDAARRLRYSFLGRTIKRAKADVLLTAHTLDDQAETVLMQLLRGTAYLTGISEVKKHVEKIVRPLLNVSRQELQDYLAEVGQDFRTDESNFDTTKTRAWLRHEIVPRLEQRYPTIKKTILRLALLQQDQQVHFETISRKLINLGMDLSEAEIERVLKQDVAVQRQVIADLFTGIDFEHVEMIRGELKSESPTTISLPFNETASVAYGKIRNVSTSDYSSSSFPLETISFEKLDKYWLEQISQDVDFKKLKSFDNLVFRSREPGDVIRLLGGTKKVSDLMIDLKIPKVDRHRFPLLASGKNVVWIHNLATDIRVTIPKRNLDVDSMKRALELAREAASKNELPVGCVIVKDNQIIGEAHNETETTKDPTAHAEVLAMRRAAEKLGDWRLEGCTLYVTLEPCPMCFGTILQAHVSNVVYGARNARDGALGSVMDMQAAPWKRRVEVKGGVLAKECGKLLTGFFEKKR